MISANLIGKCLLIGGAGAATGTGAYYIKETYFSNNKELKDLAEKAGLSCLGKPTETFGVECKKLGSEAVKAKKDSDLDVSAITGGKIKVYLKSKDEDYNKDFKFVIEDGDISTSDNAKKLEQFETYEIKDDGGKHKLIRKKKSWEEKRRMLGIPEETGCAFPEESSSSATTCSLTADKLKAINFEGKSSSGLTLENENTPTLSLKISKASADEATQFPLGYKFELQSNKDITLDTSKVIKKDTNTEFKIKKENGSLTLEKAWSVTELGKKVGLNCPAGDKKECTLNADNINVNNNGTNENNKKHSGLTKGDNGDDKKVKYEFDQDGHNQGIKFFVDGDADITLGGNGSGEDKKIHKKNGAGTGEVSYEIKKDTDNKWYLTKKTKPAPAA